jgi:hypothetical protein
LAGPQLPGTPLDDRSPRFVEGRTVLGLEGGDQRFDDLDAIAIG